MKLKLLALAVIAATALIPHTIRAAGTDRVTYHTAQVDGVNVFYREAGDPAKPAIVLLHGFPSSSHMFRNLIPRLATQYHVIAPDYPGFGYSDQPAPKDFAYTFDHLADVVDDLLESLKLERYAIYVQDYGSPVGFRLFVRHPEKISAIISQNGNAYAEGLSPVWADIQAYWKDKSDTNAAKVRGFLTPKTTKWQYTTGVRDVTHISPDAWTLDQLTLDRPGNADIQLALFYDYQSNVKRYDAWHAALRQHQPPVLAVWGKNDPIFLPAGAEAFKRDVPAAEVHLLDTGHFALEEDGDVIAEHILAFLPRHTK